MYRQGDVLLIMLPAKPEHLGVPLRTNILLEGSVTGHHHSIQNGKIYPIIQERASPVIAIVEAGSHCQIVHEEHGPIDLPEGFYEVRRQREVGGFVED